ncbi:MAG: hypothetical protein AAGE96_03750 [Cyanobacteria bacterium P01_G01_bin.19]
MKLLMIFLVFGLGFLLGSFKNINNSFAYSPPCSYRGETYREGARINIGADTYECRNGRWILVQN